jgi:RNA polymerase sigma-70 factor (ECF subfamily)
MTAATQAFTGSEDFARLVDPYQRELLAHCYRMLGSVQDAEDLVQETFLRAWRAHGSYDASRSSLRTWLYRIATNVCLTALEGRSRRPLPAGLGGPSADPDVALDRRPGLAWLQPVPDELISSPGADPAAIVASRDSVRLAFIAALQYLPGRQRAVLLLRDVLQWRAAEVAELLGTSTPAVNSLLQRARAQLAQASPSEQEMAEPGDAGLAELLDKYVTALQYADMDGLLRVLRADAAMEMPPYLTWFTGREAVAAFLVARNRSLGTWRLVLTGANGQPAIATYVAAGDGVYHAHSVQVVTVTPGRAGIAGARITRIVSFLDPGLFGVFGLPLDHVPGPARPLT